MRYWQVKEIGHHLLGVEGNTRFRGAEPPRFAVQIPTFVGRRQCPKPDDAAKAHWFRSSNRRADLGFQLLDQCSNVINGSGDGDEFFAALVMAQADLDVAFGQRFADDDLDGDAN
jgi:hypothetical protein